MPSFGNTSGDYSGTNSQGMLTANAATSCSISGAGRAYYIGVLVENMNTANVKAALYDTSGNYIAQTETRGYYSYDTRNNKQWMYLLFGSAALGSRPSLSSSTRYYIVFSSNLAVNTFKDYSEAGSFDENRENFGDGDFVFPDPISMSGHNHNWNFVAYVEVFDFSSPTVTTSSPSSVSTTGATLNGNITAAGGGVIRRGFCYKTGTSGDPTISDSVVYTTAFTHGTGTYTESLSGLSAGTSYRVRAYAANDDYLSYGDTVTLVTKPYAPTSVSATDGTYTDKVTVTWTKSTGATGYRVYRDGSDVSGLLGDVATYDDTGAGAPTITAGTAAATDGTYTDKVALSISGQSANNGSSHTYKVVAVTSGGNSADSSTDTGYRGVGTLTYQWQRSAADSDASYSNISGATSSTYNDTGAPADGSGRYYKCVLNATGASAATSSANRGYRRPPVLLAGTAAVALSAVAALSCDRNIAGTAAAVLAASATPSVMRVYSGTAAASLSATAILARDVTLTGSANAVLVATADLTNLVYFAGTADAVLAAIADVNISVPLAGTAAAALSADAALSVDRNMAGIAAAVLAASLVISRDVGVAGSANARLSTYATLGIDGNHGLITGY